MCQMAYVSPLTTSLFQFAIAECVMMYEMVCESLFSGLVLLVFPIYERITRRVIMCQMTFLSCACVSESLATTP